MLNKIATLFKMHCIATLLVVFVGGLTAEDSAQLFFNFGDNAGDIKLAAELDGFSDPINISTSEFVFFGNSFDNLFVSCSFLINRSYTCLMFDWPVCCRVV